MGLILLISVSDISLLVYKHDFLVWILTLYPTVLPNSLTRSNSFLLESIGFSMYNVHYHVICKQWQFNPGLHGLSHSTVISPSYPHTNVGLPAVPATALPSPHPKTSALLRFLSTLAACLRPSYWFGWMFLLKLLDWRTSIQFDFLTVLVIFWFLNYLLSFFWLCEEA